MQVLKYIKPYNYAGFVAHNPFIIGNSHLVASCYQDGTLIYDISDPQNPVLTGFFDTYPQGGANTGNYGNGYGGNWGSYPFFPSGLIFSNDMANGIFILKADTALGIAENTKESLNAFVFPNPVKDVANIYINQTGNFNIEISDISGKVVLMKTLIHNNLRSPIEINLPEISSGLYLVTIRKNQQIINLKLLKN
jgi:hypothetical protein